MANLCNKTPKESTTFDEFLACNNVVVLTLPSLFFNIVKRYGGRNKEQSFRMFTDIYTLRLAKVDAVLVDKSIPCYEEFARDLQSHLDKNVKYFLFMDNKFIKKLK